MMQTARGVYPQVVTYTYFFYQFSERKESASSFNDSGSKKKGKGMYLKADLAVSLKYLYETLVDHSYV